MFCLRKYLEPARTLFLLAGVFTATLFLSHPVHADDANPAAVAAARGIDFYRAGKFAEALAAFRDAGEANPESGDYPYLVGLMCERGEGAPVNEVEAARYYRMAWKNGNTQAHERLTTMYAAAAGGQKVPPPILPFVVAAAAAAPAVVAVADRGVSAPAEGAIELTGEMVRGLPGVHFRSSRDDKYRIVVSCPDNCTDLAQRTSEVASILGARVVSDPAGARPDRSEYISYQSMPVRFSEDDLTADAPRPLDLTLTCQGWCGITRVVAKAVAEKLGAAEPGQ